MMILFYAFILAMTSEVLAEEGRDPYNIGKMQIINNTCRYRGYGIPDSVCMDLSIPCVSVCCRATKSQLVLTGCPAPKGLPSDNGHPFWPGCCTQPSPEPPVTLLERSLSPEAERHTFMSAYQYRKFQ